MTEKDKEQALKRSKKYQADFDRYASEEEKGDYESFVNIAGEYITPLSLPAKVLCRKYKIPCPVVPRTVEKLEPPLKPGEKSPAMPFAPIIIPLRNDRLAGPEEDGYMTMRVNLACSLDGINKCMKQLYKIYSSNSQNPKASRARESDIDIWEVYDMEKDGLTPIQIARKLSGLKGTPAYNDKLDSWVKKVKAACKKAKAIITTVES